MKGTRSAGIATGLSEINTNSAAGTLIAFATDPGKTALDGKQGENSPFTTALLKHMETPGISISSVMDRVREEVWRSTGEKQRPWVNTSIIGEFHPDPEASARVAVAALSQPSVSSPGPAGLGVDRQALEMRLWNPRSARIRPRTTSRTSRRIPPAISPLSPGIASPSSAVSPDPTSRMSSSTRRN